MDRVKPNEPILVFGKIELDEQSRLNVIAHHAECNDTAINALKADIQAMSEGEAKTTASGCHLAPGMKRAEISRGLCEVIRGRQPPLRP
jgi:hypothetical protein